MTKLQTNLKYSITLADKNDIDEIIILTEKINKDLLTKGMTQWNNGYPNEEVYLIDIELKSMYKMLNEKGQIIGIGSINQNQHPNFAEANWQDKSDGFRLIYRLGIDPEYQNNGLAGEMMNFLENIALEQNATSIRLGALSTYDKVVNFYLKRNYSIQDKKGFPVSKSVYYLMEKILQG